MTSRRLLGPILLCLTLCAACSSRPQIVPVPVVERVMPPPALAQDTARPTWTGRTNGDLLEHAIDLGAALDRCNADKAALRAWAQDSTGQARLEEDERSGR
ncbi:Rz1-like lysis system protein LysC [Desulfocurvibacter africanus]|uniref:Rz1-like lysis system protein LysC n=1 Tax=Desulfocurvibacter africanus TaxID=873 RepID=UPI000559884F|nr:Rz1-like lysis system protein LysC [Desulfocurvibacter africanus]